MKKLYVLACFDKDTGDFVKFVRKGRSYSIVGYDEFTSAKRGHAHSSRSYMAQEYDLRIVKANDLEIVEVD